MWFNQAIVFSIELPNDLQLEEALSENALQGCPPHARFSYGWLPVFNEQFVQESTQVQFIRLGKEERILPKAVLKKILGERIEETEAQKGRPLSRAEKGKMAEDLEFELLPKAFCLQKKWDALLDLARSRLVINSGSATQASQLITLLRKALPGISITPVTFEHALSPILTQWLYHPHLLPAGFTLAETCQLIDLQDEKKKLSCKGYDLTADEIRRLIEEGLTVAELSLVWQDRISFTLTHEFVIKRMKCMDYLVDEFQELSSLEDEAAEKDAALALLAGETRTLIDTLIEDLNKGLEAIPNQPSHQEARVN